MCYYDFDKLTVNPNMDYNMDYIGRWNFCDIVIGLIKLGM
jgi:hypothetical protein